MHLRYLATITAVLASTLTAKADPIQLTSASQLSAGDSTVSFPTVSDRVAVKSPKSYKAGGNKVTISNASGTFQENTVGTTYDSSGFSNGTNILTSSGFNNGYVSGGLLTVKFANAVSEFGFNAEDYSTGDTTFTLSLFSGATALGTYTEKGNDPLSLAFLGTQATGAGITSFTLSDTVGNDISIGNFVLRTEVNGSSVTPEPSSLALLGTGILGVLGAARRRFVV